MGTSLVSVFLTHGVVCYLYLQRNISLLTKSILFTIPLTSLNTSFLICQLFSVGKK